MAVGVCVPRPLCLYGAAGVAVCGVMVIHNVRPALQSFTLEAGAGVMYLVLACAHVWGLSLGPARVTQSAGRPLHNCNACKQAACDPAIPSTPGLGTTLHIKVPARATRVCSIVLMAWPVTWTQLGATRVAAESHLWCTCLCGVCVVVISLWHDLKESCSDCPRSCAAVLVAYVQGGTIRTIGCYQ